MVYYSAIGNFKNYYDYIETLLKLEEEGFYDTDDDVGHNGTPAVGQRTE